MGNSPASALRENWHYDCESIILKKKAPCEEYKLYFSMGAYFRCKVVLGGNLHEWIKLFISQIRVEKIKVDQYALLRKRIHSKWNGDNIIEKLCDCIISANGYDRISSRTDIKSNDAFDFAANVVDKVMYQPYAKYIDKLIQKEKKLSDVIEKKNKAQTNIDFISEIESKYYASWTVFKWSKEEVDKLSFFTESDFINKAFDFKYPKEQKKKIFDINIKDFLARRKKDTHPDRYAKVEELLSK